MLVCAANVGYIFGIVTAKDTIFCWFLLYIPTGTPDLPGYLIFDLKGTAGVSTPVYPHNLLL